MQILDPHDIFRTSVRELVHLLRKHRAAGRLACRSWAPRQDACLWSDSVSSLSLLDIDDVWSTLRSLLISEVTAVTRVTTTLSTTCDDGSATVTSATLSDQLCSWLRPAVTGSQRALSVSCDHLVLAESTAPEPSPPLVGSEQLFVSGVGRTFTISCGLDSSWRSSPPAVGLTLPSSASSSAVVLSQMALLWGITVHALAPPSAACCLPVSALGKGIRSGFSDPHMTKFFVPLISLSLPKDTRGAASSCRSSGLLPKVLLNSRSMARCPFSPSPLSDLSALPC